jgi:hypothetical protein
MLERNSPEMNLFIDDGGVISDNRRRPPQMRRLAGEFMSRRLGGSEEAWAEANSATIAGLFEQHPAVMGRISAEEQDWPAQRRSYLLSWVRRMADYTGIAAPPDYDACVRLAIEAHEFMAFNTRAAFPGAARR